MTLLDLDFDLYPKQLLALTSSAQLVLYGGAAGGGKSHLARIAAIGNALRIPGLQVYLFRRHYNDLLLNHLNGPTGFRALLFPLMMQGLCTIVDDQIRFYNGPTDSKGNRTVGSVIYLCHCQHEIDVEKYRGAEIHFFIPEETTQFTETQLRFLLSRVRIPEGLPIPAEERHCWPKILMPTNPGGKSHSFLKSVIVDPSMALMQHDNDFPIWTLPEEEGGWTTCFVRAKLADNPSIDPVQYRKTLMGLKRPELIDAMLNGSWDIPLGAFFPEADERIHRIPPIEIPRHLFKFRTFDWGFGAPFCVQWWAVADGILENPRTNQPFPRGSLICYREWYGCNPSKTTEGIGLSNRQIAEGIIERTPHHELIYNTVADSKPFQATGMGNARPDLGSTPATEMKAYGVPLEKGVVNPGSRILGWQQLHSRLIDKTIFFFNSCSHTWRTLVEIQTDPDNVEDCDSDMEDHPVDCIGLACKARPVVKDVPKKLEPKFIHTASFDDVLKQHMKLKRLQSQQR